MSKVQRPALDKRSLNSESATPGRAWVSTSEVCHAKPRVGLQSTHRWSDDPGCGARAHRTAYPAIRSSASRGQVQSVEHTIPGALCYVDAYVEPEKPSAALLRALGGTREEYLKRLRTTPTHLCRLRYFGRDDAWSMAFFTYSHERYQPCSFGNGRAMGTPEQAFAISAVYLG